MSASEDKTARNARRRRMAASATVLAGAAALFWTFAGAARDGMAWKAESEAALVAPDFEERVPSRAKDIPDFTLRDRFGNEVSLARFQPVDVLLVNIWSSGCPVCKTEIPSLMEMDKRLSSLGKVALLTITVDEKWEDVEGYFPRGTDLRVLFDPTQKVAKGIFGTVKYPETFILDKERRVRARFDGERSWHLPEMLDYIATFR